MRVYRIQDLNVAAVLYCLRLEALLHLLRFYETGEDRCEVLKDRSKAAKLIFYLLDSLLVKVYCLGELSKVLVALFDEAFHILVNTLHVDTHSLAVFSDALLYRTEPSLELLLCLLLLVRHAPF